MRLSLSGNDLRGTSLIKSAGELITKGGNCISFLLRFEDCLVLSSASESLFCSSECHRCQGFWFVWSEKCNCPEGAIVRPGGPNF